MRVGWRGYIIRQMGEGGGEGRRKAKGGSGTGDRVAE